MDKYGLAIYNENRVKKRLSTYLDCGGLASVIFPPMAGESCIWGMSIMKTLFQIFSSQNPAASCQRTSPVGDQQQCLSCIGSLQRMEQFLFMKGI